MNRRPKTLSVFALFLIVMGLFGSILGLFWGEEAAPLGRVEVKLLGGLSVFNGVLASRANKLLYLTAAFWLVFLAIALYQLVGAGIFSLETATAAAIFFTLLHGVLFLPQSRIAFRAPERRFWLHAKRNKILVQVKLNAGDALYDLQTHDLSTSGAFVTSAEPNGNFCPERFSPRDPVELTFFTSPSQSGSFKVTGEVVRLQSKDTGSYPNGVGIRFHKMGFLQRLQIIFLSYK